jgi:hypothetical protein
MGPHDVLKAPGLDVIAANHLFDLSFRACPIIDQNRLALTQLAHRRFVLKYHLRAGGPCQSGGNQQNAENYYAYRHDVAPLRGQTKSRRYWPQVSCLAMHCSTGSARLICRS